MTFGGKLFQTLQHVR